MSFRYPKGGFITAFYDPLQVPNAPTIGTATAGDAQATVEFTAPSNVGGSAITAYYAVSNPDRITATGASSPITVTGLTNDTAYTFQVWALNSYGPSPFSAASGSVTPALVRALFAGGWGESVFSRLNTIDYVNIPTTGNAVDFGDLSAVRAQQAACASSTRGLFGGGDDYPNLDNVKSQIYLSIFSTLGNTSTFGDLTVARTGLASCSSSTRGLWAGGEGSGATTYNVIDYVTIASTGNATDFGDLTQTTKNVPAGCASTTRGIFGGGSVIARTNVISYVTIASAGNASDFGDLLESINYISSCSSSTRGLFGGGFSSTTNAPTNIIQYITIASTGNATDFGDLANTTEYLTAASSSTRGLFAGGQAGGSTTAAIRYVTIASLGNTTSFGDLTVARNQLSGCSNAHGGL